MRAPEGQGLSVVRRLVVRWLLAFPVVVLAAGCATVRSPEEMAATVRSEGPACTRGDAGACQRVCANEGPNASCDVACKRGDAEACFRLADRLDKSVDALEPGAGNTRIEEPDSAVVTSLYEKACGGGLAPGCRTAGERMLNGQGGKKDGGALAVTLLKRGCQELRDGLSCCSMAQLNNALAASGGETVSKDDSFLVEARRWRALADTRGVTCPAFKAPAP